MDNELKGKVVAGYQAWFRASEDLDDGWIHWSRKQAPGTGKPSFEIFPDTREYPEDVLYPSGYSQLGDGRESKLFSSRTSQAIDLHFSWAKDYGIDCLALQRFYSEIVPERLESHYNKDHLQFIKASAEKHGRMFYVMYDFSGAARHGDTIVDGCTSDWVIQVEESGLINSPNYACYEGKKIVCLWGLTGLDSWRYPSAKNALALIQWFRNRGYYVIGGFPDNDWALVTDDYAAVYREADMISPWVVGRFGPGGVEKWWEPVFKREREYCIKHGKAYMPVAFPGFAWCSFNGGYANAIPRQSGQFFWDQAKFLLTQGIENIYLAMFDEYDEATAFMKAAEDSTQIPVGESYFLTLSVDGYWLSSDYYLRLAGAVGQHIRSGQPVSEVPPVAHSTGPVYWRNGFEMRDYYHIDKKEHYTATVDIGLFEDKPMQGNVTASVVESSYGKGKYALHIKGTGTYKIATTKIDCKKPLALTYAASIEGIQVGVVLEDGSCMFKPSGEAFSVTGKIYGIAVSIGGGEGFVDAIVLQEA
ncbi:MAG: glycoside hydrolase family 71/99-like protein [Defluviitaleaceae bacterium]|nr:glycoside hydrolase family 71/99-like protein [Defluviitaleaceae bacterium]